MTLNFKHTFLFKSISILIIAALLIAFDPAPQALAQIADSLNYKLSSASIDEGSSKKVSGSKKLQYESIGQAAAGKSSSASYKVSSGFIPIIQSNPPVQTPAIPNFNWQENQSLADAFDLDNYFSSPDGYALIYSVSGNSDIIVGIDQTTNLVSFSQAQAWFGTEEVFFTATDTEGNSVTSNPVSLQVEGVDNPPVLDFIENITIQETELVAITAEAHDLDGDSLTYSYSSPLDTSGQWQTDHSSSGTYTVTVTATDPGGLHDEQQVTITVTNLNRPPILDLITDITAFEGDVVTIEPTASDLDQEDVIFYYSTPFDSQGSWLTGYEDEGSYSVTVTASDEIDTVSQIVNITINNTNRAPSATLTLSDYTVTPGENITVTLNASDLDGDALTFILEQDGTQIASGAISLGIYTMSVSAPAIGDHTISATVTDGSLPVTVQRGINVVDPNTNRNAINPVMGDFNGDSLSDLGLHNSDTGLWQVCLSDEGEFRNAQDWNTNFGTSKDWIPVGGDFNADSRTDVGLYNNKTGQLEIALSSGSSFVRDAVWLTFSDASYDWQPLTGNFNGDKFTDFGVYNKNTGEIRIALGKSGGFNAFTTWLNSFGTNSEWILLPGDFNGDSLTDISIFKKTTGEFKVAFSTSKGFVPQGNVWITDFATDQDPLIADFNNDGFADVGYWDKGSTWYYAITRGNSFISKDAWLSGFGSGSAETAHTGDFNGDGITDAATFDRDLQGIDRWDVHITQRQPVDLLVKIDNGIGGTTDITYQYAAKFNNDLLPFPVYVAKTISVTDTLPAESPEETYIQSFEYSGGWFDAEEREFRGFNKATVTDPITGNFTETYFLQGKVAQGGGALKGKIDKLYAYDGNNRLISSVINVWDVQNAGPESNGLGFPYLKELTTTVTEENNTSITTQNKLFYDTIGNVTNTINEGDIAITGDEKQSFTTYNLPYEAGFNRPQQATLQDKDNNIYSKKAFEYDTYGNLTKESVYVFIGVLNTQYTILSTSYNYDSFGNLTQTTNPKNSIVTTNYETNFYTFPESVTNSLGHSITYEYNTKLGVVTKVTDSNGTSSESIYDTLGRVVSSKNGFGETVTTYSYPDFNSKITTQINISTTAYIDGLGRNYKTITQGEDGRVARNVTAETFFNNRGLKDSESLPHYVGEAASNISYIRYEYDIRGRIKKTISDFPGSQKDAQSTISYLSPLYTETTDPKGHRKGVTKDVYGNNIMITEFTQAGAYNTHYLYDIVSNLTRTTDTQGNITQISYDSLGRKLNMDDPDMGTWTYEYDLVGNLVKQTDAKNQALEFEYDIINRLTRKFTSSVDLATYYYDDVDKDYCTGRLSKVVDQSGQTEFFYDKLGREIKSTKTVDTTAYTVQRTYDILDRLINLTYPDSTVVTYSYDTNSGYLQSVAGYVDNITYDAQGKIKTIEYGNDTQTDYTYGSDLRLSKILTTNTSETIQNLNYIFDKNGNLTTLTDNLKSNIRSYQYDDLDRLTQAQNIPDSGSYSTFTYQYDPIGNMTYKSDVGVMVYGEGTAGPHAVTTAGGTSYLYDVNGNMTQGKAKTFAYDTENRLTSVLHGLSTTDFLYDGDGGRVKKTTDGRETIYIGSLYEIEDGEVKKHIFAGSNKVCTIEPDHTYYTHGDHLGSSSIITDETGAKLSQTEYQPYGQVSDQEGPDLTNYKFTGKELDSTGLYYYGARYYDPEIGRFITADTIIQSPYDPQTFNRYTYCRNNPLKYIDPTGHIFWKIVTMIVLAIIGYVLDKYAGAQVDTTGARIDMPIGPGGGSPAQPSSSDSSGYLPPSSSPSGSSTAAGGDAMGIAVTVEDFLAMSTSSNFNQNAILSKDPTENRIKRIVIDGHLVGVLDIGQAEGGVEGKFEAAREVLKHNTSFDNPALPIELRSIANQILGFAGKLVRTGLGDFSKVMDFKVASTVGKVGGMFLAGTHLATDVVTLLDNRKSGCSLATTVHDAAIVAADFGPIVAVINPALQPLRWAGTLTKAWDSYTMDSFDRWYGNK